MEFSSIPFIYFFSPNSKVVFGAIKMLNICFYGKRCESMIFECRVFNKFYFISLFEWQSLKATIRQRFRNNKCAKKYSKNKK